MDHVIWTTATWTQLQKISLSNSYFSFTSDVCVSLSVYIYMFWMKINHSKIWNYSDKIILISLVVSKVLYIYIFVTRSFSTYIVITHLSLRIMVRTIKNWEFQILKNNYILFERLSLSSSVSFLPFPMDIRSKSSLPITNHYKFTTFY